MKLFDGLVRYQPQALGVLRTALQFIEHGTQKLFNFPVSEHAGTLSGLSLTAGLLEFVGGILLVLGLFTRPVAFLLSGEMAIAYFMAHMPRDSSPSTMAAMRQSRSASFSSIWCLLVPAPWRWTTAAALEPPPAAPLPPHPLEIRVEQRCRLHARGIALTQELDLETVGLIGDFLRHVAHSHRRLRMMRVAA